MQFFFDRLQIFFDEQIIMSQKKGILLKQTTNFSVEAEL